MLLYEAIKRVIAELGIEKIKSTVLVNALSDYEAFKDYKATRNVIQTLITKGYGEKIYSLHTSNDPGKKMRAEWIIQDLVDNEGLAPAHARYVVHSITFALGWDDELPEKPTADNHTPVSSNSQVINIAGIAVKMIKVEGDCFSMGATIEQGFNSSFDEKPAVNIELDDFHICDVPVTQELWEKVMHNNPSHNINKNNPVERVSWEDATKFCKIISTLTGVYFRLPTEAEWEYAARGGNMSKANMFSGAQKDLINDYAWTCENSQGQSHPVREKLPNELGIYDMSGNVSEWCSDWYFNSYSSGGNSTKNPQGPSSGSTKVHRGGSWFDKPSACRVSKRAFMNPKYVNKTVGFRLVAKI